jgi:hypothetical protein
VLRFAIDEGWLAGRSTGQPAQASPFRASPGSLRIAVALRSLAGATGLEPATYGVTGRHSNQLSYAPAGARGLNREGRSMYGPPLGLSRRFPSLAAAGTAVVVAVMLLALVGILILIRVRLLAAAIGLKFLRRQLPVVVAIDLRE